MIADISEYRFNLAHARRIDTSGLSTAFDPVEAAEDDSPKTLADNIFPLDRRFGSVRVDGQVVAEIDNRGVVTVSDEMAKRLGDSLPQEAGALAGPALARARAEQIAGLLGGTVEESASALSQRQYDLLSQPAVVEAIRAKVQGKTVYQAQQAAQAAERAAAPAGGSGEGERTGEASKPDAVREFLEWMEMTPEERLFESILRDMGLTREALAALPPEERIEIEEVIREKIKKLVQLQDGDKGQDA